MNPPHWVVISGILTINLDTALNGLVVYGGTAHPDYYLHSIHPTGLTWVIVLYYIPPFI